MLVKNHNIDFIFRVLKIATKHKKSFSFNINEAVECDVIRIGQIKGNCYSDDIGTGAFSTYTFYNKKVIFYDAKIITDEMIYQALNIPILPKKVPSNPDFLNLQNFEGHYIEIDGVKYCLVKGGQHCKPIVSLKSDQKISFKIT